MVEADFVSAVENAEFVLPSAKLVSDSATTNLGFERFNCELSSPVGSWMKCWKLQLWPDAAYSNGFRFEKGKRAEAYYYDFAQTGAARWKQNRSFFL